MRSKEWCVETINDQTGEKKASPAGGSDRDLDGSLQIIFLCRSDRSKQATQRISCGSINGIFKLRMPYDGVHVRTKPQLRCEEPQAFVSFGQWIDRQIVNAQTTVVDTVISWSDGPDPDDRTDNINSWD